MTEVELWMIEWVVGENEISFHTSGGVSALGMENLSVPHTRCKAGWLLYWSSCNGEGCFSQHWYFHLSNNTLCVGADMQSVK